MTDQVNPPSEVKTATPPTIEPRKQLPDVTILICTYDRYEMLIETIQRLRDNLSYPADKLKWIICDDSSPDGYAKKLGKDKRLKDLDLKVVSTETNSGWGANVNHGLTQVSTDYVFFIEDDYYATTTINLDAMVALMEMQANIGMVRARGIAGTQILALLNEADVSDFLPEWRDGQGVVGKLAYWQLSSGSATPYVYSNGPHLKHRRFHEFYGEYPTDRKLGETEESYAHMVKDAMATRWQDGAPAIAILPLDVIMWFDHVGDSYQLTDADKKHD